jgi:predicted MarR family transcription regulator
VVVEYKPDGHLVVYLDDIIISGTDWQDVWRRTFAALKNMVDAGFMINLNKCKFVTSAITAVGHEVSNGRYKPTIKKLQLLLSTPAPRTLQELQSIAGRINHYKRFVPDFQRHFKPIK